MTSTILNFLGVFSIPIGMFLGLLFGWLVSFLSDDHNPEEEEE